MEICCLTRKFQTLYKLLEDSNRVIYDFGISYLLGSLSTFSHVVVLISNLNC